MKITMTILFLCLAMISLNALTIYEIQYTTDSGSGTYPSPYAGQNVTTQGIVTATGYSGTHGYYISMPEGGAWKGVLVYDTHTPVLGNLVEVTGQCTEYYGMTEIKDLTSYQVISSGNPIPPAAVISTAMASTEAYEGVLMEIQNATVTEVINTYGEWAVSDGSGEIVVADALFDQSTLGTIITIGANFESIKGLGNYTYGTHSLNPRSAADVALNSQTVMLSLPTLEASVSAQVTIPITVSTITSSHGFGDYHFQFSYNPNVLSFVNASTTGTLSSVGNVMATPTAGSLDINFFTNGILVGQGTLLNLNFTTIANGVSPIIINNFFFDNTQVMIITQGMVTVGHTGGEVLDTLSVIQRPLLNIPAIVIPGETFNIECTAPTTTTGWAAWLYKGNLSYPVTITNSQYENNPPRWVISATVPNVSVYELYDLRVTASGGINDRTRHSVQVLPTRKPNYYFAHITDIHMPSHIFYPETGWDTDSTETVDLREVINDLNVIRPEFVLVTGDLTNQGPLEDFQNQREYTKAKRLLGEFEIPCYLVTGNHDIGGWSDPPMPSGSARKFWWKNFGWSWLNNSSSSYPYHTQDYSFDYGPVHFTGLESYDNYDNYLTNIYGGNSFTNTQMQWLQADLTASDAETKVLFNHYDFDEELNLSSLGVDMSLWGHIHYDSGNIYYTPYNLSTRSVCDGNRAYRIVRVNGTTLQPYGTVNAGTTGGQIRIDYTPNNYGVADSVFANVINNQPLNFENAVVKFVMPANNTEYTVTGGILEQVDRSGSKNICYVRVNLTTYTTVPVSIKANTVANEDNTAQVTPVNINTIFPNPFKDIASISISNEKTGRLSLKVYNLKGEMVRTIYQGQKVSGVHSFSWDGKNSSGNQCPAGMYLIKLSSNSFSQSKKVVLLK